MSNEVYKKFIIHPNLRAYLDHAGKLTPMFVYTEFATLDEVKARVDRYWSEWEEFEAKRKQGIGKAYNIIQADTDLSDEAREIDEARFEDRVNQYYEREHYFGD